MPEQPEHLPQAILSCDVDEISKITASDRKYIIDHPHSPWLFWIGCSDARVPETSMLRAREQQVFTHRHIANLFHGDSVKASLVFFSNLERKAEDREPESHLDCGGVKGAYGVAHGNEVLHPDLRQWLDPLIAFSKEIGPDGGVDRLTRENIRQQVKNVLQALAVQGVEHKIGVHGYLYKGDSGFAHLVSETHPGRPTHSNS
ncbi:carbonic anhydrase [Dendrothele bispora CBS 962.96]|uniref:Carbonic anhydrase n=1 Tax=Dendrothele bispora (strain CBS 962.96) TaxID=1314807 RepID=A0A4S8KZL0_DENBC|nr:carbonic anhydrase [Dendrothele bispora CBS 962.96]